MPITTIGLDIAKNVFQEHGIDAAEKLVAARQRRGLSPFARYAKPRILKLPALKPSHAEVLWGAYGQGCAIGRHLD